MGSPWGFVKVSSRRSEVDRRRSWVPRPRSGTGRERSAHTVVVSLSVMVEAVPDSTTSTRPRPLFLSSE